MIFNILNKIKNNNNNNNNKRISFKNNKINHFLRSYRILMIHKFQKQQLFHLKY